MPRYNFSSNRPIPAIHPIVTGPRGFSVRSMPAAIDPARIGRRITRVPAHPKWPAPRHHTSSMRPSNALVSARDRPGQIHAVFAHAVEHSPPMHTQEPGRFGLVAAGTMQRIQELGLFGVLIVYREAGTHAV